MFNRIGQLAANYSWWVIGFWLVFLVAINLIAPTLDSITEDDTSSFLPSDSPSLVGGELLAEHFPQFDTGEDIVIVVDSGAANGIFDETNSAFLTEISNWLISADAPTGIANVTSAALNPAATSSLTSPDGQVQMIIVTLEKSIVNQQVQLEIVEDIREGLRIAPAGTDTYQVGQVTTFIDYNTTANDSVSSTFFVTIILVAVILLVIFRSPVSPLIPLGIVTVAFMSIQAVVALVGQDLLTVSSTSTTLMIVVIYGAGTDYCLFLISRFREEMAKDGDRARSTQSTVRQVGESIFNSAATTTTGFLAMVFTQFGLFNTTGPILSIAVVMTLAISITLTPAVMNLLGKRAFWPAATIIQTAGTGFYGILGRNVRKYAVVIVIGMLVPGIALAAYGLQYESTFDALSDLPDSAESVAGFRVLEEHIGAGNMQPVAFVAEVGGDDVLGETAALTRTLEGIDGVASVRSAVQPFGPQDPNTANITLLNNQLGYLATLTTTDPNATEAPSEEQQAMLSALLGDLPAYLDVVAAADPALDLADVYAALDAQAASEGGIVEALPQALGAASQAATPVHINPAAMPDGVRAMFGGDAIVGLVNSFINAETHFVRFEIILADGPYTIEAMDTLNTIADTVSGETGASGSTAISNDIRNIITDDLILTVILVLTGIFLVLIIMLRSLVAPAYLIGTIVMSYTTTLGVTRIGSEVLFGQAELVYWVPFMMFVFLVALGIDYSIYLFGRIKEEMLQGDIHYAIQESVIQTGSIITSAGIIVAGTFAALMTGDLLGLQQVGFAVAVGILIDTVAIRTVFVPALASIVGKWSWYPGPIMKITGDPNVAANSDMEPVVAGD